MPVSYMTKDGYNKILAEIDYLENVKRPEISAQIAEARDKGDLSENAEYDAAKEAQGIMEAKLAQLKGLIANARLIDESRVQTDEVQILNKVKIKNMKNNAVMTYTLVCRDDVYAGFRLGSKPERGKNRHQHPDRPRIAGQESGRRGRNQSTVGHDEFRNYGYINLIRRNETMASIFSRIVAGEIPSHKVAENDEFFAFLDINPVAVGHTLMIPKQEIDYIFDIDDAKLGRMMAFAKRVARAQEKAITCKRVGLAVMGLEVPHAHIHLVPITKESDMYFGGKKLEMTQAELADVAAKIRAAFE